MAIAPLSAYAQGDSPFLVNQFGVRFGFGASDNITRAPVEPTESNIFVVGTDIDWLVNRPRYDFDLQSNLEYIMYSDDSVDDLPNGDVDARFTARLIPERIEWFVDNTYSQIRQDPTVGSTPDNLSDFNVISTGINMTLPVLRRTSLDASVSYGDRRFFEAENLDSTEIAGGLSVSRQIDPVRKIGLAVSGSRVDYEDESNEYDIYRAFARYESELASGNVLIDLGANRAESRNSDAESDSEPLFRLSWTRDVATRSTLTIGIQRQIVDLGSSVAPGNALGLDQQRPGRLAPFTQPFDESRVDLSLSTVTAQTNFTLGGGYSEQEFQQELQQDQRFFSIRMRVQRLIGRGFGIAFAPQYRSIETQGVSEPSDEVLVSASLFKDLGRRFRIGFSYQFFERSGDPTTEFKENQYRIDLATYFRGAR